MSLVDSFQQCWLVQGDVGDRGIQFFSLVKLRNGGVDLDFRSRVFTGVGEILFTEWKGWYYQHCGIVFLASLLHV